MNVTKASSIFFHTYHECVAVNVVRNGYDQNSNFESSNM